MTDIDVPGLVEELGWHHEHPVTGKMVLINPDGPRIAAALQAQAQQIADLTAENARLRELLAIDPWSIGWAKWKARAAMKGSDNG